MIFNQPTLFRSRYVLLILLSLCFMVRVAQAQSASGYQMPADNGAAKSKPAIEVLAARGEAPLSRLFDYVKVDEGKIRRLPALQSRELPVPAKDEKRLQVGVVRNFLLDPLASSSFYQVAGGRVGVIGIISEGALMTRAHFADVSLPAGAKIFVYSMKNPDEFYGPYEGVGPGDDCTFWTPPVEGEGIVIEYFIPDSAGVNPDTSFFNISGVSHVYRDPQSGAKSNEKLAGACNLDVTPAWTETAKSVGRLQFTSGGGEFLCTGTLLNTTNNSQIPYLLTAHHCFSTQAEAQTLKVYWNYNAPPLPPVGTNGANLLATGQSSDFTFVQLTGSVPAGLFLSGWDAAAPPASATDVTGIHHPDGDYKRIAFGVTPQAGSCFTGLQCLRVQWKPGGGTTEPGSSGSGLWKGDSSDPKLIGTLTGGAASCSNPTGIDQYGRFDVTYPAISSFLTGTACVTSISPTNQNFSGSGGTGTVNVTSPGGCNWTATSTDSFVTVTSGASGSGNGSVGFSVAANSGPVRSASLVIGGKVFGITQAGGGACAATPITVPQTVNGALNNTSDCPLGDGYFGDAYSFNGVAGQQISVSVDSTAIDTYLFLYNADGSVTEDDDSGPGTNSRIPASGMVTLSTTGTYTIVVSSFDQGEIGAYTLTLAGTAPPPPPTVQFSTSSFSKSESGPSTNITVTRTGDTTGASSVDFRTEGNGFANCNVFNGAAVQNCDFILNQGTLTFAAGQTSRTFPIIIIDDTWVEGNENLGLTLSNPVGATLGTPSTATLTIIDNDTAGNPSVAQKTFIAALSSGQEVPPTGTSGKGGGIVQLDGPETSGKVGLVFSNLSSAETDAHIHGPAAPGVSGPIVFPLPLGTVIDHNISPTTQQVADLKAGLQYMNVHSSNFTGGEIRGQLLWNPLNEPAYLVTQHYYDFLGRLPDQGGLDFWVNSLTGCGINVQCLRDQTVGVSNAFFYEQEYQQTASFVFLLYRAAYGDAQPFPNPDPNTVEAQKLPRYLTFVRDRAQVVGGAGLAASQSALANAFVQRPEFIARYPLSLSTGAQFVDAVLATIQSASGVTLAAADRNALITHFNNGGRGLVMFHLANDYWNGCDRLNPPQSAPCVPTGFGAAVDNRVLIDAEYNRSFVYSQYSGYFRRDADIGGFLFWLNQVSTAPPRNAAKQHAMVCAQITSAEYQLRFGPNTPRNDIECSP